VQARFAAAISAVSRFTAVRLGRQLGHRGPPAQLRDPSRVLLTFFVHSQLRRVPQAQTDCLRGAGLDRLAHAVVEAGRRRLKARRLQAPEQQSRTEGQSSGETSCKHAC
jgi:hypothetical protein